MLLRYCRKRKAPCQAVDPETNARALTTGGGLDRIWAIMEKVDVCMLTTSFHGAFLLPIIQFDFTGSVRNRSLDAVKGGSSITDRKVCCPSSIRCKFPIALVMFSLNFAPA
jgi:hypothetical protein